MKTLISCRLFNISDYNCTAQLRADFIILSTLQVFRLQIHYNIVPCRQDQVTDWEARGQVSEDTIEPFFDKVTLLETLQVERPAPSLETV